MYMTPENSSSNLVYKLANLPNKPGTYLFKNNSGKIIYIGKASNLKKRISSYFVNKSSSNKKIIELKSKINDFEIIITESEQEALLLENSLIKKNKPFYNVRLKDDKSYPYIKVNLNESYPRVYITRKNSDDGARYFGPYASASSIRKTLNLLNKLFPYRSCTKVIDGNDEKPCLEFHIKRCIAPCTGNATKKEYMKLIDEVISFLEGKTKNIKTRIKKEMHDASKDLNFEKAALIRDRIKAIEKIEQKQKVVGIKKENIDVIGMSIKENFACLEIFFIRNGNMVGHKNYIMEGTKNEEEDILISRFIENFYSENLSIPKSIVCSVIPVNYKFIIEWLSSKSKSKISIKIPKRGKKNNLVKMANENAKENLKQLNSKINTNEKLISQGLRELQEELGLPNLPKRIECFDISHLQGSNVVASMSVFQNGQPMKSQYRKFKIKDNKIGNDDYASMKEVIKRRLTRIIEKGKKDFSFSKIPDLILIDGGKGQLSAVMEVILNLGVRDIAIASIAKKEERIFLPDFSESITLPEKSQGLFLLQKCRDEAHRFAVTYHRNIRANSVFKSPLDHILGIGPNKKKTLLNKFGSINSIKNSTLEEISQTKGINKNLAIRIKESL
ncbi:MAG: excinuclease ABC subunit C [Chloroflexi bacterium]|nr:excinuclease ABC subunit C [Chloroflexota bacterium]